MNRIYDYYYYYYVRREFRPQRMNREDEKGKEDLST